MRQLRQTGARNVHKGQRDRKEGDSDLHGVERMGERCHRFVARWDKERINHAEQVIPYTWCLERIRYLLKPRVLHNSRSGSERTEMPFSAMIN